MKKRTLANLIMVAVILVIAAAGVLTVGHIQGWFDKADADSAVLTDIRGILTLEREGLAYPVMGETVLRTGDKLTAGSGATGEIRIGGSSLAIGSQASVTITEPASDRFAVSVTAGEVFLNARSTATLRFDDKQLAVTNAVISLSVRSGAQSVYVYAGTVASGSQAASSGQMLSFVGDTVDISSIPITALNDFLIEQVRKANETQTLCFTQQDLDRLAADRQQALQDLLNSQAKPTEPAAAQPSATQPEETLPQGTRPTETVPPATQPAGPEPTSLPQPTEPAGTLPPETKPAAPSATQPTEPAVTAPTEPEPAESLPTESSGGTCIITIRCDTILDNMENLNPAKAEFVPADGVILPAVAVAFGEGETVFDVLKRVCEVAGIQLEYSWSPAFGSYYIEGINNLYQRDCGSQSGWMYKVNEWFPNYGCSGYTVQDGDVISWCYSCNGFGADVGA